jgi:hypothetical protein
MERPRPVDPYHPTVGEHVPDHDRLRVLRQGLIGSYQRKYDDEPRFRFSVDYLAELMLRLSDEIARQPVANIPRAVDVVVDDEIEPRVQAWLNRLDAGRRPTPPAAEIFDGRRRPGR